MIIFIKKHRTLKTIKYKIKLNNLNTPKGTISVLALRELVDRLIDASEKALKLAIDGTSSKKGQPPTWLKASVDFLITGLKEGSTVLEMDCPTLRETAKEKIAQQDLWNIVPDANDTALSIVSRSLIETAKKNYNSNYFDAGLLKSFSSFESFLKRYSSSIDITTTKSRNENFSLDIKRVEKIGLIEQSIPEPRKIIISGLFDLIEHSEGKFRLKIKTGETITGEIDRELVEKEKMRTFWGKEVTIKGWAEFTPKNKIRYVKADLIKEFENGDEFLNYSTRLQENLFVAEKISPGLIKESPLKEIWGKWPGDESVDEVLAEID